MPLECVVLGMGPWSVSRVVDWRWSGEVRRVRRGAKRWARWSRSLVRGLAMDHQVEDRERCEQGEGNSQSRSGSLDVGDSFGVDVDNETAQMGAANDMPATFRVIPSAAVAKYQHVPSALATLSN